MVLRELHSIVCGEMLFVWILCVVRCDDDYRNDKKPKELNGNDDVRHSESLSVPKENAESKKKVILCVHH